MDSPMVSITVSVRNGAKWIEGCLQSLLNQSYPNFEILAVNDGSTDDGDTLLQSFHDPEAQRGPRVVVHHQSALGLAAGRQWALEHARGEWVAITDIDVRPEPNWLTNLMMSVQPMDEQERVVAVTGRTVFEQAKDIVSRLRSVEIAAKYRSRPRRTSLANGPCSVFNREALLEVGGFDPAWYHAEDMEVSLRLVAAGGTIVYAPEALVKHVPESGLKIFLNKRRRDARAHVRIVRHHPRRRRRGPDFDFIGSSTIVLSLLPMWLSIIGFGLPLAYEMLSGSIASTSEVYATWQGKTLVGSLVMLVIHEFVLWRGPLGVVNREVIRTSTNKVRSIFRLRRITFLWSIALWQGLVLGGLDALRGANGHRRRSR